MEIKGIEYDVDNLVKDLEIEKNFLKRRENGLLLNDYQIEVLNRNGINYKNYSNLSSLLFAVNEFMEDSDEIEEELEQITRELEEIHYYKETYK